MELKFNKEEKKYKKISLRNYLNFYDINLILNNNLIRTMEFELYNYEELYEIEKKEFIYDYKEEIKQEINNIIRNTEIYNIWEEIEEIKEEVLYEFIQDHEDEINDNIYFCDIFQYYIINERDIKYLSILNYPIYYNYDNNLYMVGITHYGTSWDYILTNINIINNTMDFEQISNLMEEYIY